jgi:hypothetical protein
MPSWIIKEPENLALASDSDVRELDLRMTSGRLSVVGTDGPPRIEISRVAEVPLRINLDKGVLRVAHDETKKWPGPLAPLWWWINGGRKFGADISIAVPYATRCRVWVASGSIVVSAVHADVTADCVSGRMTLLGVDGHLRAKVVSGPVEALGCAGEIDVETVSGEITLADLAASRLRAKTVSGTLTVDLDNPPYDSDLNLETVSGEITIRVREDSDLEVAMSAAFGRVTSDFAGMSVESRLGAKVFGKLGNGTGRLVASAVGGNIALLRRPVDVDFGADAELGADAS